ncbi:cytokine receptor-like isoform X2 [Adelges cooleyi]|uniref:cytokine receptor-like isoform X2 n=1 Tax=Adelges cooleyi TaxID=133065 RepID=UPI00217F4D90|nr:cytokine receptor-like isoform X2 [Adelges cooleyi]
MERQQLIFNDLHNWPSWTRTLHIILFILCSSFIQSVHSTVTCGPGITSIGGTVPKGNIVLEYDNGTPLEITCALDPDNYLIKKFFKHHIGDEHYITEPSQKLLFYRNHILLSKEYITVINATAARLFMSRPPAGHNTYYCTLLLGDRRHKAKSFSSTNTSSVVGKTALESLIGMYSTAQPLSIGSSKLHSYGVASDSEIGVCLNHVAVGYKPLPVTNFTCISLYWKSLSCNWTKPNNPVKTTYKIVFKLPGRAGGRTSSSCPSDTDVTLSFCYWDFTTSPIYRPTYEYYYFTIIGENLLGTTLTNISFHHYAHVIPESPTNITVMDKTQTSAMLQWSVGRITTFPRNLVHRIEYKSQWEDDIDYWHSVDVSGILCNILTGTRASSLTCRNEEYYYFNVTDLKYPFTLYTVRIYLRLSVAIGENMWSTPGVITLKTKPAIPKRPPRTDIGSFECTPSPINKSTRDIIIYWQHLDDSEQYGDLFGYRALYTSLPMNNQTIYHLSNETYKSYAKFQGLSNNVDYIFLVYSTNEEGSSVDYSTIFVASEKNKIFEPLSFTKMAYGKRDVFELSWKHNSDQNYQLGDYTIFWCKNDKDRPYQCNGYINWVHVARSESSYNISMKDHTKIYQFAISANEQSPTQKMSTNNHRTNTDLSSSSSGMVWASCTVLYDKSAQINKTVNGETSQGNITQLNSHTTYKVIIFFVTIHGVSLPSEPLFNTTLEGAPDVTDLQIDVTNVTNTSISLQWTVPMYMNGILRYYQVYYYNGDMDIRQPESIDSLDETQHHATVIETKCRLSNLNSYRYYNVAITACTTVCSERSKPIRVQTDVGMPGKVAQPTLTYESSTIIVVSWPKPTRSGGPVNYYQLDFVVHRSGSNLQNDSGSTASNMLPTQFQDNLNRFNYTSYTNTYRLPVSKCDYDKTNGPQTFSVAVRAVNLNPHDSENPYYGPWSAPGSTSCVLIGFPLVLQYGIWSCLVIVLVSVIHYYSIRAWRRFNAITDVQIILPQTINKDGPTYSFENFHDCDETVVDCVYRGELVNINWTKQKVVYKKINNCSFNKNHEYTRQRSNEEENLLTIDNYKKLTQTTAPVDETEFSDGDQESEVTVSNTQQVTTTTPTTATMSTITTTTTTVIFKYTW